MDFSLEYLFVVPNEYDEQSSSVVHSFRHSPRWQSLLLLLSLCTHVGQPAVSGTGALPSMATDIFSFC